MGMMTMCMAMRMVMIVCMSFLMRMNMHFFMSMYMFFSIFTTNPIILGILAGMLWSVLKIPQPVILQKSVSYLGNMATPLALIAQMSPDGLRTGFTESCSRSRRT